MKKVTVETLVYEPGDVIDISKCKRRYPDGRQRGYDTFGYGAKMLILSTKINQKSSMPLYRGIVNTDKLKLGWLKANEIEGAEYVTHIDLGEFGDS